MRYIDNSTVQCPVGWQARADTALQTVTRNDGTIPDRLAKIWRDFKAPLKTASHDKCWYCEIKEERSDNAVDHFRPKDHYWWSAFSAENFRFSCTYCNSKRINPGNGVTGGKGNSFPLYDESQKATCKEDERRESPMLLDPCRPSDLELLDFTEDGEPCAKFKDGDNRQKRAELSINLYHLNHKDIVEKRCALALRLNEKIVEADELYPRCHAGDQISDNSFNSIIRELARAMSDRAELSSFSRRVISGHRDKDWIEMLLATT